MDTTPHLPIYLDYGATTPCDPRVVDAMIPWLREHFGNPASRSQASVSTRCCCSWSRSSAVSSGTARELFVATLQPGRMLEYSEGSGWTSKDAHGRLELPGIAGPADSVQYNAGGSFGGADYVAVHGGDLLLKRNVGSVTTPPTDSVKLWARVAARTIASTSSPAARPIRSAMLS